MKKLNYIICLDFETGGLSPTSSAVTQIGMEILHPVTFKVIEKYSSYIYPYFKNDAKNAVKRGKKVVSKRERTDKDGELYEYSAKALEYTNITMDMLYKNGKPIGVVMDEIVDMFKKANPQNARNYKPMMLGQNFRFDIGFLQHMAEYCGTDLSKYLDGNKDFFGNFQPNYFDTLFLAKQYFATDNKVTSHKLGLMADKLGVELVNAHDAMADVEATSGIFQLLMRNMRSSGGTSESGGDDRARKHFNF